MKYVLPAAIAIGVGLITLLSYFITSPVFMALRLVLTDWAVILGGLAVLIGLLNLILINFRRVQARTRGWYYGFLTALVALATFFIGAFEGGRDGAAALYAEGSLTNLLFKGVILSSQATLAGLVMIFLVAGALRLVRARPNHWTAIFLTTVAVVLVGWYSFSFLSPLNAFREWVMTVPAMAGANGILIGVALGTLMVGLRVLAGIERPYKD